MKLRLFQVDAFAERVFEGNPAAVCPLEAWLDDWLLQAIAEENNLSETAFFVRAASGFELRWFTPDGEVDLCGHATLASAHVLFNHLGHADRDVHFHTRSGKLTVTRGGRGLRMDFPATAPTIAEAPAALLEGLGKAPAEVLIAADYIAVYDSEEDVKALRPDFAQFRLLDLRGVIATAPGMEFDFVSRFFAPKHRINEDPVTGSAHCELAPYWSKRLGRQQLTARQISKRGGTLDCELDGDRVILSGSAVDYMTAEIEV